MPPEDNPADDVRPTREEWEAHEAEARKPHSSLARPTCGKCGKVMTPANARLRPELFLHDACLPDGLKPAAVPMPTTEADLAELRRLDKEAAPPPWRAVGNTLYIGDDWFAFLGHRESVSLIAAGRNHLGAVLDRLAAAEADRDRLKAAAKAVGERFIVLESADRLVMDQLDAALDGR